MPIQETIKDLLPPKLREQLRVGVYRTETVARRPRFAEISTPPNGWQILLGISFPKSGTRLINRILVNFSEFTPFSHHIALNFESYDAATGLMRSVDDALAYLDSLRPLDVTAARLVAWDAVVERVTSSDFIPFFIYRDPRDIALSYAFDIAEVLPNNQQKSYAEELHSFDERLTLSILGFPETPNIAEHFSHYTAWLDCPEVLKLHFEDFIHHQRASLGKIYDHFAKSVPNIPTKRDEALDILEEKLTLQEDDIWHSGKTNEWKKYFTEEHKRIFKEVAGDLLIKLGYEEDENW